MYAPRLPSAYDGLAPQDEHQRGEADEDENDELEHVSLPWLWTDAGRKVRGMSDDVVRLKLRQVFAGWLPLRDFQVWFAPLCWGLRASDPRPLARKVELRLAEYTCGDWTKEQVVAELAALVFPASQNVATFNPAEVTLSTTP
jgi:hypothetical protein